MVNSMESLAYEIVDVFTDRAFTGNPLAVVFGADGLGTGAMQALAREFHLSETVFVLPPTTDAATYRLRIFTIEEELPFAGHPSVGAAVTQMRRGLIPVGDVTQECGAGLLPVRVAADGSARLRGGQPTVGAEIDARPLLAVVGLAESDLVGPAPRFAGCGLEFPYLRVRPDAVARIAPDVAAARVSAIRDVSVFSWDADRSIARTRVFFGSGLDEDPATGSAALGLGVWLVRSGLVAADGESRYTVEQGVEMGRPSTLVCTVTAAAGRATEATVSGAVVPVARGEIAVPAV
jgi:trans-2,3-dihydro-3-hydroxyanthranilate isomerase